MVKKGYIPWNKGKKMTVDFCKKVSLNNCRFWLGKKKSEDIKKKISEGKLGKKHTEEHNHKISLGMVGKKHHTNRPEDFYKRISLLGISKQQNSKEPTSIEKKVYQELEGRGFLFEKQYLVNGRFLVDVYIPKLNLIIECDGDYWHGLDRVVKKDKAENAYLKKCGYKLYRFSEQEINRNVKNLVDLL